MKLLAIETATETCSVALQVDDETRECFEPVARQQTERVLPMAEQLLADAGLSLTQLDAIAFSAGPGAFTGVRVAVSVAQGLAWGADLPLLPVSTLACTAMAAARQFGEGDWLILQDARMNELYLAGYRISMTSAGAALLVEEQLSGPDQLPPIPTGQWRAAGTGQMHEGQVRSQWQFGEWAQGVIPRAAALLPLAQEVWRDGKSISAAEARPVYLRNQVIQGAIR